MAHRSRALAVRLRRGLLAAGAVLPVLPVHALLGQRPAPPVAVPEPAITARLAVVVAGGRVYVYPSRVPADGEGWRILRDGAALTPEPMRGVQGPDDFSAAVGDDMGMLQRITSTESVLAAYRRLRAGGTAAGIAQVLSPRAAAALGALYVDSTVAEGSTHSYAAELVRLARPDSVLRRAAATVRVVTMGLAAPGAPGARAADGMVSLTWTPPRFAGAPDDIVVAYTVERADSAGAFARITSMPVMRLADQPSAFQDEAVVPGQAYRYRLRAADLLGRLSEPGPPVSVRARATRGPVPPPQLATEVTDGRIRVVWTLSPEPRTRGYIVERAVGGDSIYRRLNPALVGADAPEFTDTLVRGREVYTYRVRAVDDARRAGAPSNPTTTRGLDERPPAAPTGLAAAPMNGHGARLSWKAPPDRDLRGYYVHRAERRDSTFVRLTGDALHATVYADSGYAGNTLEPGREYAWRVMAVDSSGNISAPAEVRLRIVDDEAPDPVRSVFVHNQLGRYVEVSWTGSPSIDVARYVVERVVGQEPAAVVATVAGRGTFAVRDTMARKGRAALWRVVAIDTAGNRATPLGDTLTFRDLTRPPAPRRVTAVRTDSGTVVRWERVVSTDLRGYVVYRAERSDGPRTRLTQVPLTLQAFVDRGAPPRAHYVVRAVDASGNESDESPSALAVQRP